MTDRKKRDPLKAGHPRRMGDARCAWIHMDPNQRQEHLEWLRAHGAEPCAIAMQDAWYSGYAKGRLDPDTAGLLAEDHASALRLDRARCSV